MSHENIAEALTGAMREDGCELDSTDRLIIRQTPSRALTAQRRRADRERSASSPYTWTKPTRPRR
ncbi:hypothetical protein EHW66_11295 [Erwinia psidii]|uniref:hypothetical protein n=1 Tax=Erwinia psidii TaxID=69224 RepID=UPI00226B5E93|nr:hypothetical protein [Erwinia psidii]MCX8958603.1 hypothetical protein [Erwinia psidii]MCX8965563.1 hypothetical protein [Erwinia psidii]